MAQIDTPRFSFIKITYFNQHVFQVPQLFRFVGQTQILELACFKHGQVNFRGSHVYVSLYSEQVKSRRTHLALRISCQGLEWQVSHLANVLSQSSAVPSNVSHLHWYMRPATKLARRYRPHQMFGTPPRVETLRVSAPLAGLVADVLNDAAVEIVLPALHLLYLEDEPVGRFWEFITERQLSGLPITIANASKEFLNRRGSHLWRDEKIPHRLSSTQSYPPALAWLCVSNPRHLTHGDVTQHTRLQLDIRFKPSLTFTNTTVPVAPLVFNTSFPCFRYPPLHTILEILSSHILPQYPQRSQRSSTLDVFNDVGLPLGRLMHIDEKRMQRINLL